MGCTSLRTAGRAMAAAAAWLGIIAGALGAEPGSLVPLCPGLRVVTAVSQMDGDYESIKTIEAIDGDILRLRYSNERMVEDLFSAEPPKLKRAELVRRIRVEDLQQGGLYLQQFSEFTPDLVPGTTAIGLSRKVFEELRAGRETELGIFQAYFVPVTLDLEQHPNVYDHQMVATVRKTGSATLAVTVNDRKVELPAIRVEGEFYGDDVELYVLDDPANPLTLQYRFGIGRGPADPALGRAPSGEPLQGDRDRFRVVKISHRCGGGSELESALRKSGRAEVYDLFFAFGSAEIRAESETRLAEIAAVLLNHPDWRVSIEGHTDSIADDQLNLELSRKRAEAVRAALIARRVPAQQMSAKGFGESQPRDTNETPEGRARNRRVELALNP
ncbi:MAG: OmpA family protein [Acidobacteria bacterium]|nr:OmpA family protein [Acidobacteriota bacterium]